MKPAGDRQRLRGGLLRPRKILLRRSKLGQPAQGIHDIDVIIAPHLSLDGQDLPDSRRGLGELPLALQCSGLPDESVAFLDELLPLGVGQRRGRIGGGGAAPAKHATSNAMFSSPATVPRCAPCRVRGCSTISSRRFRDSMMSPPPCVGLPR